MKKSNKHAGSNFDDFLNEEGLLPEVEAVAIKRVIAYKIAQSMEKNHLTKTAMATKMHTSRASIERLLDPDNTSITLQTLTKAAAVFGQKISISLR